MTPSEAIKLGLCPSCKGKGDTYHVLEKKMGSCSSCHGDGKWPPACRDVTCFVHGAAVALMIEQGDY